jgi:cystathionine gamma-synthase
MAIATWLSKHNKIEKVFYPGLTSHRNHEVAKRQMTGGFGAVLSVCVKGGRNEALDLCKKLQLIKHATSLGGVETLIEHRRSAEGAMALSPDNLLRISVGIEYVDDLIKDFERGLK